MYILILEYHINLLDLYELKITNNKINHESRNN